PPDHPGRKQYSIRAESQPGDPHVRIATHFRPPSTYSVADTKQCDAPSRRVELVAAGLGRATGRRPRLQPPAPAPESAHRCATLARGLRLAHRPHQTPGKPHVRPRRPRRRLAMVAEFGATKFCDPRIRTHDSGAVFLRRIPSGMVERATPSTQI